MKKALPANAKISEDAMEMLQECVSEFTSFVTGEDSDKCRREKRKTINGDDLLWVMCTLGFEEYVDPLEVYRPEVFREVEAGEKAATYSTSSSSPVAAQLGRRVRWQRRGDGACMYAGGGMTMMEEPVHGASPASASYHHQMGMGKGLIQNAVNIDAFLSA